MWLLGYARNAWRQLTSMRTALVLLFLLALAAIPGSILPQRSVNVDLVNQWYADNPDWAPTVDRLGGFDVYGSPWFSAIYLLLFTSLVGCVVPRLRDHLLALRKPPVDAPRGLSRLPQHRDGLAGDGSPAEVGERLRAGLRSRRWRAVVREQDDGSVTVSAEKGYLKETGNLLMHFAMLAVLVGVALGSAYGWNGNRLVVAAPEQNRFCNELAQYDEYGLGSRMDGSSLPDFCLTVTGFEAEYTENGSPTRYLVHGEATDDEQTTRPVDFTVNSPLRLDGASVYLLGEGYAPVLRYTDRFGETQTTTAPFLPNDPAATAEGIAAFPDANVDPDAERDASLQVAFEGLYLPTAPEQEQLRFRSLHPEERAPRLWLRAYRGDLGVDDGTPQSVYSLNQAQIDSGELAQVGEPGWLAPGERMTLDDDTTVEFVGTERWITVSVRYDPGQPIVLGGAAALLGGLLLSLLGRRRRVWFRVTPDDDPTTNRSNVSAGGLPRSDYPGFATEFSELVASLELEPTAEPDPVPATSRST